MMALPWVLGAATGALLALVIFWIFWMSVSALARAQTESRLTPLIVKIGTAYALLGEVWDVACNVLICTFLFLDVPREPTLSQRLRRLVMSTGWRQAFAIWIAVNLVNPFSPDPNSPHIPLPPPPAA